MTHVYTTAVTPHDIRTCTSPIPGPWILETKPTPYTRIVLVHETTLSVYTTVNEYIIVPAHNDRSPCVAGVRSVAQGLASDCH